jgi:menaquinone-dependent protoporphyrinogen oxidase
MKRVLVVTASKHGSTAEIGARIGETLRARGVEATVSAPAQAPAPDGFDAVVLGSAVYVGHWLEDARKYVDANAAALRERPVWLFSSGPVGDPPKPADNAVDVASIVEATDAREHRLFGGKVDRNKLGFAEKAVVIALRVPDTDSRNWDEITLWAAVIAGELSAG